MNSRALPPCLLVAFSLSTASLATAADWLKPGPSVFNYHYIDLQYLDLDGGFDGFAVTGSGDIRQNIAAQFNFSDASSGSGRFNTDFTSLSFGLAWHKQSATYAQADWVFSGGFNTVSVDTIGGNSDDTGLYVGAAARVQVSELLEADAGITLNTANDSQIDFNLQALYQVSDGLAAMAGIRFGDRDSFFLGIRAYWR